LAKKPVPTVTWSVHLSPNPAIGYDNIRGLGESPGEAAQDALEQLDALSERAEYMISAVEELRALL
jgi:hypothetical protein